MGASGTSAVAMTNPLWGHWLRIKRADEHRRGLHDRIAEFIHDQPYGVTYEFRDQRREVSIGVERVNPTDDDKAVLEWGIAVGDCIHQLRAALDGLVYALTEATNKPPPPERRNPLREVSFPIVTDPSAWPEATSRRLWGVPDESLPVFREVQPFFTGPEDPKREPLAVLNELWNVDKHRAIPLLAIDLRLPEITHLPPELGIHEVFHRTGPLVDGQEIMRLGYAEHLTDREVATQLDHHLRYTFEVAFDEMPPWIQGRPLIMNTLELFEKAVTAMLIKFEPYFL